MLSAEKLVQTPINQLFTTSTKLGAISPMKIIQLIAKWLCTIGILISVLYTVIAVSVAFFIITGTLTPGDAMYIDSNTPSLTETLGFTGFGLIIITTLAYSRSWLSKRINESDSN